jgi:hypothetical protein
MIVSFYLSPPISAGFAAACFLSSQIGHTKEEKGGRSERKLKGDKSTLFRRIAIF